MIIGIIGTGNQASKFLKILKKQKFEKLIIFHPTKKKTEIKNKFIKNVIGKKISFTNSINNLNKCNSIFIASTSNTHIKYLKFFYMKKVFIFCEKPPATNNKDLEFLSKIPIKYKKKIKFNFQLPYTPVYKKILDVIREKKLGNLINFSVQTGNGIAFDKNFKNNWRFRKNNLFNGLIGNLGIHYLHYFLKCFKKVEILNIFKNNFAKTSGYDTAEIIVKINSKINSNVFMTYASPFLNSINILFTNGILNYFNNELKIYYLRNTFDKKGNYKIPKCIFKLKISKSENQFIGTENILKKFLSISNKNGSFDTRDFNISLKANKILLDYKQN